MAERPNPRELLGGYATSTLSREEREVLLAAALEDQQLFDELVNEDPLRELLDNPLERQMLANELSAERLGNRWFSFAALRMGTLHAEGLTLGGVAGGAIVIAVIAAFFMRSAGPPANQPTIPPSRQEPARVSPLAELRTQALRQGEAGQREQALNSVVQGLQIDRKDAVLMNIQGKLLREAQAGAAQSRQEAIELDARERAGTAFGRGVDKEREAQGLRVKGRIDEAIRSFWNAADQFKAAAAESSRIADAGNRAEPAPRNKKTDEPPAVQPPVPSPAEQKPTVILTENVAAANQALRRYETAYATMRADAVRGVYPSAPIDELERDFAGATSCTVKIVVDTNFRFVSGPSFAGLAIATGRMTKTIVKKSGAMPPVEREVTIQLEKQGNVWIITRIR